MMTNESIAKDNRKELKKLWRRRNVAGYRWRVRTLVLALQIIRGKCRDAK